jgi:hypothetical protein
VVAAAGVVRRGVQRGAAALALALALGCASSEPGEAVEEPARSGEVEAAGVDGQVQGPARPDAVVYRFTPADNWGSGLGCELRGERLTLRGRLRVKPFGKGTDGAILKTGPGREEFWVLSYRAEGPLLELDGERVVATGQACDKQGEAIYGEHFNLETLRRAPK